MFEARRPDYYRMAANTRFFDRYFEDRSAEELAREIHSGLNGDIGSFRLWTIQGYLLRNPGRVDEVREQFNRQFQNGMSH